MRSDVEDGNGLDMLCGKTEKGIALQHWSGGLRGKRKKTGSTQNDMEEDDSRRKTRSWGTVKGDVTDSSSKSKYVERECQSLTCLMAWRDKEIQRWRIALFVWNIFTHMSKGGVSGSSWFSYDLKIPFKELYGSNFTTKPNILF